LVAILTVTGFFHHKMAVTNKKAATAKSISKYSFFIILFLRFSLLYPCLYFFFYRVATPEKKTAAAKPRKKDAVAGPSQPTKVAAESLKRAKPVKEVVAAKKPKRKSLVTFYLFTNQSCVIIILVLQLSWLYPFAKHEELGLF